MAFGRLERAPTSQPMSDINMTPLIDVMLVLLVIFIIAAPFMANSLRLELPQAAAARPSDAPAFISLALDADGRLYLADQPLEPADAADLVQRVREAARGNADTEVHLRADSRVPYGRVAELIGAVQEAGLTRIGFVAEAPAAAGPSSPPAALERPSR
jgi:biopolymer transport protein ExbD